jgi:ribosomal protein S11
MLLRFLILLIVTSPVWPQVPKDNKPKSVAGEKNGGKADRPVPPVHVVIDQPYPTVTAKPEAAAGQDNPKDKSSPWFVEIVTKPEWVIVDVTAIYVVVAWFTLLAIKRQASDLEQQIKESRESSEAAARTAAETLAAISRQADLMKVQADYMRDGLTETKIAAKAATESAATAQRTLEISQRANIAIEAITLKSPLPNRMSQSDAEISCRSSIEFKVRNTGSTVAKNFYFELRIEIPWIEPGFTNPTPIVTSRTDLHPGMVMGHETGELETMFAEHFILRAIKKAELEANGFIRYSDVFGKDYRVDFNSRFDPRSNTFSIKSTLGPDT